MCGPPLRMSRQARQGSKPCPSLGRINSNLSNETQGRCGELRRLREGARVGCGSMCGERGCVWLEGQGHGGLATLWRLGIGWRSGGVRRLGGVGLVLRDLGVGLRFGDVGDVEGRTSPSTSPNLNPYYQTTKTTLSSLGDVGDVISEHTRIRACTRAYVHRGRCGTSPTSPSQNFAPKLLFLLVVMSW